MTQAHIFYSGVVQGVGFRYTVQDLANDLNLNGWVRNRRDGRVEILVEGTQETIEEFCRKIEEHFEGNIRDKNIRFQPAQGTFKSFEISYTA